MEDLLKEYGLGEYRDPNVLEAAEYRHFTVGVGLPADAIFARGKCNLPGSSQKFLWMLAAYVF